MNFLDENKLTYLIQKLETVLVKKSDLLDLIYPIGSIYMTTDSADPSTTLGGHWQRWGNGRTIVGVDERQSEFSSAEQEGGATEVTLTTDQLPAHNHNSRSLTGGVSDTARQTSGQAYGAWGILSVRSSNENSGYVPNAGSRPWDGFNINLSHTHTAVGGSSHNNLQPYQTCYMWKRVEDEIEVIQEPDPGMPIEDL